MELANKRILLTGATGGVGQLVAQLLAKKGAILALVGRDMQKLNALQVSIHAGGGKAVCIEADLSKEGAAQVSTASAFSS